MMLIVLNVKRMIVNMLVLLVNLLVLKLFVNLCVLWAVINLLFSFLFTSLFALFLNQFTASLNFGQPIVTRLIKTVLAKTNTEIINKNFSNLWHVTQKQWIVCIWLNFCFNLTETLALTVRRRMFQSKLPWSYTKFIP